MFVLNSRKNTLLNCNLDATIIDKIKESIVYNSQSYIEMDENSFYVPVGNGTEVSLIKWLQAAEIPVHDIMATRDQTGRVCAQVPFNSNLKRSIIAVEHPQLQDTVRIYVKGAPEIVIANAQNHYDKDGNKVPFRQDEKDAIFALMEDKMTTNGFRTLAFSYRDMSINDFRSMMSQMSGDIDSEDEIRHLEQDQTFLSLVALADPVR
jgi:magnesium-transporting ATPase (P-type)